MGFIIELGFIGLQVYMQYFVLAFVSLSRFPQSTKRGNLPKFT